MVHVQGAMIYISKIHIEVEHIHMRFPYAAGSKKMTVG
jgi:hypothetical protein